MKQTLLQRNSTQLIGLIIFLIKKLQIEKVKNRKTKPSIVIHINFKNWYNNCGLSFLDFQLCYNFSGKEILPMKKKYLGACANLALFIFYDSNDLILYLLFIDRDGPVAEKVLITIHLSSFWAWAWMIWIRR